MGVQFSLKRPGHFSPLRYPGGKASLSFFFSDLIKELDLSDGLYVEPYAGGAGAAVSLLMLEKIDRILINDLDPAIYCFWNCAVYRTDELISLIDQAVVTVDEWKKQRVIYRSQSGHDELELGFAAFFLNRVNRSGIVDGGPIGGMHQSGQWTLEVRFNKEELIERIKAIGHYRSRILVRNSDALTLLRSVISRKRVFIYLDPPYYQKGSSLYLNYYGRKDHENLARFLNRNSKACWLLTYDNVDAIKDLYSERQSRIFNLSYSAYKKEKGSEVLILSETIAPHVC